MTSHLQLTITNVHASCLLQIDDVSFKCIQRCSWRAVPGRHDGSEWFKWHSLTLPCFDMTSHSQLTIANSRASCLPPMDEGSFKYLERCSWRAVPGLWKQILHWFFHFPNQLTMSKYGSNENPLMSQLYFCMLLAGQTSKYLSLCHICLSIRPSICSSIYSSKQAGLAEKQGETANR